MERQEIPIRFAELRQLARLVPAYIAKQTLEQPPALTARLEEDLSLVGADLVFLLEEFSETYCVDIANFNFTGLISREGLDSRGCLLAVPVVVYWLTAWLLRAIIASLCWPFSPGFAGCIWQWRIPYPTAETADQPNPLTVGDFVASAAVGRFVKREQVYFQLVR